MGGSPDFYLHIRTLIALVIGLSITHNLGGAAVNLIYQVSDILRLYNRED